MRDLLTPALASQNPRAYAAHFRRLGNDAQRQYLEGLTVDELGQHFAALGEPAVLGLVLEVGPGSCTLEVSVGGARLGKARGLAAAVALQARAQQVGAAVGARAASGLLKASIVHLPQVEESLAALAWETRNVVLAGDSGGADCSPALSWALRGAVPGGSFYMAAEPLRWDERAVVLERLEGLAARTGAVLDTRLS